MRNIFILLGISIIYVMARYRRSVASHFTLIYRRYSDRSCTLSHSK